MIDFLKVTHRFFIRLPNNQILNFLNLYCFICHIQDRGSRSSVSNESNVLLDPDVLPDSSTQALVLTVLATLVKYSRFAKILGFPFQIIITSCHFSDEAETRVLYQYLAEGSVVFPKVFPVM